MIFSLLFAASAVVASPVETSTDQADNIVAMKETQEAVEVVQTSFEPFTGKVTGAKVRLRLRPSLDGFILKELSKGELLVVTGESDDFYAVMPEKQIKGYLYRAYVLDNIVEANNVNLRLDPDLQSPIITQLQQGCQIFGSACAKNNKWLEVNLPEDVRFYVSKEYVAKAGDVAYFHRIETKREQTKTRFAELEGEIAAELKKPFQDINLAGQVNELKELAQQNQDLPEYADSVQALVKSTQDTYLELSQAYQANQKALKVEEQEKSAQVALAETSMPEAQSTKAESEVVLSFPLEQQEAKLIAQALEAGNVASKEAFYATELRTADELFGQLVPYTRPVKNRPGDFVLVHPKTKVPLAYLYSSRLNLGVFSGKQVRLLVVRRPNHDFALPAYFVLDVKVTE